jgi:hypothetical protein
MSSYLEMDVLCAAMEDTRGLGGRTSIPNLPSRNSPLSAVTKDHALSYYRLSRFPIPNTQSSYHTNLIPPPQLFRRDPSTLQEPTLPLPGQPRNIVVVVSAASHHFPPNSIALSSLVHLYIVYMSWFRSTVLGVFWRTRSRWVRASPAVAHAGG